MGKTLPTKSVGDERRNSGEEKKQKTCERKQGEVPTISGARGRGEGRGGGGGWPGANEMNLRQEGGTRTFKVQRVGVHSDRGCCPQRHHLRHPPRRFGPWHQIPFFPFVQSPRDCVFIGDIMIQRRRKTLEGRRKNRRHDTRANSGK